MTTLCAWRDPASLSVWVGSDRMLTCGDFVERRDFIKWRLGHSGQAIGVAGDAAVLIHGEALMAECDVHTSTVHEFARALKLRLREIGWNICAREPGDSAYLKAQILYVRAGELYELIPEQDWAMHVSPGRVIAAGTGARFATGAWDALEGLMEPRERMWRALEVSIERDVYSGGEPWVYEVVPS